MCSIGRYMRVIGLWTRYWSLIWVFIALITIKLLYMKTNYIPVKLYVIMCIKQEVSIDDTVLCGVFEDLLANGVIEVDDTDQVTGYVLTDKGRAMIHSLCDAFREAVV